MSSSTDPSYIGCDYISNYNLYENVEHCVISIFMTIEMCKNLCFTNCMFKV